MTERCAYAWATLRARLVSHAIRRPRYHKVEVESEQWGWFSNGYPPNILRQIKIYEGSFSLNMASDRQPWILSFLICLKMHTA